VPTPRKTTSAAAKKKAKALAAAPERYRVVCRDGHCLFNKPADDQEEADELAARHRDDTKHARVDVKPPVPRAAEA
jgi:hypothetical protein